MITLDVTRMIQKSPAHEYLMEMLSLPDYYGKNLDALYDCLTEMEPVEIHFVNVDKGGMYSAKILKVFRDASKENPGLVITID